METQTQSRLYVVNVEDVVVQSTTYIVKALDAEHAAKLISEIAGLLVAVEINLGEEYLLELEIRNSMPKMLNQT